MVDRSLPTTLPEAIVMGGSAGAVEALSFLFAALHPDRVPGISVVIHQPLDSTNRAVALFDELTEVPVFEAEDKAQIGKGCIYFAPSGYHLLVEKDRTFSLSVEPAVNYSRPSIDVLFESAADAFGEGLVGILLTGANHDGAAGLKAIRDKGGFTIVQDPSTARYPQMPQAALDIFKADLVGPLEAIKDFLIGLNVLEMRR